MDSENNKNKYQMTEQKHTHDPLNVDEALSTSEAFLIKNKNVLLGIVIVLVVVVGGYLGYKHFISEPNELQVSSNWQTSSAAQMPETWPMHTQVSAMLNLANTKMPSNTWTNLVEATCW